MGPSILESVNQAPFWKSLDRGYNHNEYSTCYWPRRHVDSQNLRPRPSPSLLAFADISRIFEGLGVREVLVPATFLRFYEMYGNRIREGAYFC